MLVKHRLAAFGDAHFGAAGGAAFVDYFRLNAQNVAGIDGFQPFQFINSGGAEAGPFLIGEICHHHRHSHRACVPSAGREAPKMRLCRCFVVKMKRLRIIFGGKFDHLIAGDGIAAKGLLFANYDVFEIFQSTALMPQ